MEKTRLVMEINPKSLCDNIKRKEKCFYLKLDSTTIDST